MGPAERATLALMEFLLLLLLVTQLAGFWLSTPSGLVTRFADDAYFYFKIARGVAESGRFTFDGATTTNGFHPLWMGLLIPVFAIARNPLLALRVAGTLNVVLLAAACFLGFRYVARRYSFLTLGICAVIVIRYFLAFAEYSMETSLLLPLCVLALMLVEPLNGSPRAAKDGGKLLALGVVMALIQLARLDAVMLNLTIVASVCLYAAVHRRLRESLFSLWGLVAPSLIAGAAYLTLNRAVFDHFLPVSAKAKSAGAGHVNVRALHQLLPAFSWGQATSVWTLFSAMILASLACALLLAVRARDRNRPPAGGLRAAIASAFCLAFVAYYLVGSSWRLWGWYVYPGFLVAVFAVPEIVSAVESRLSVPAGISRGIARLSRLAKAAVVLGLVAVTCVAARTARWGSWRDTDAAANFMYQNYVLAGSLNERFSRPPTMAMGDRAGSFGYFYKGSVLQLEGLVGDYHLLDAIKHDRLAEYMSAFGVKYVVSHNAPPSGYGRWALRIPTPEFGAGPYAAVRLCEADEVMRVSTRDGTICVWNWPSCERQMEPSVGPRPSASAPPFRP